jgi:hypothetical protein
MKIVGTTEDGYLVSMSEVEMQRLAKTVQRGYNSITLGQTIDIDPAYESMMWVRNRNQKFNNVESTCKKLLEGISMLRGELNDLVGEK